MTTPQLAGLCGAFLAGSLFIAGTNVALVRSMGRSSAAARRTRIAMIPRWKGDAYVRSCREGAEEAARELDLELVWDGPNVPDPTEQFRILEAWGARPVDAVAVAVSEPSGISVALRKQRAKGIPVVAWDSDAERDARDIFVSPSDALETGRVLAEVAVDLTGGAGEGAVLAGASTGSLESFRTNLSARNPSLKLAAVRRCGDDPEQALREAQDAVKTCRGLKVIVTLSPTVQDAAAQVVQMTGRKDVKVIGVGLPDARDLGYLTVYAAARLARHQMDAAADSILAGRLGRRDVCGGEIVVSTTPRPSISPLATPRR